MNHIVTQLLSATADPLCHPEWIPTCSMQQCIPGKAPPCALLLQSGDTRLLPRSTAGSVSEYNRAEVAA